jgi:hypothetical protein
MLFLPACFLPAAAEEAFSANSQASASAELHRLLFEWR